MQVAGAEVLVTQIIERLKDQIDPTVFCLDRIGQLGEELQQSGIPVVVLGRKAGIDLALTTTYGRELRDRNIQLVHAHQYTPFFYSAISRMRGAPIKILMTEHGRHYPDIVTAKRRWFNRWFLTRFANHSTACCRFSADALSRHDGFRNVEVLYNGIDLRACPTPAVDRSELRSQLGMSAQSLYVVCIARFHPVKDHPTLILAFKQVVEKCPNARLVLVGTGDERSNLEKLVQECNLQTYVEFWGLRRDVHQILRAADLFCLTSVSEAASLTLLEAMAMECPVAITDVGGNPEHIDHGKQGLLSPRGDSDKLAENILFLLQNEVTAKRMARAAKQRVESDFRLVDAIDRYYEIYKSIVTTGRCLNSQKAASEPDQLPEA
jgi:L-malate glycosyltransferase